jgi:hypothetical protein
MSVRPRLGVDDDVCMVDEVVEASALKFGVKCGEPGARSAKFFWEGAELMPGSSVLQARHTRPRTRASEHGESVVGLCKSASGLIRGHLNTEYRA